MFQFFVRFLCVVTLISAVFAQNIFIANPTPNTNVAAGSEITVQLNKPMSLTGSKDIAVAIGIWPCTDGCPAVTEVLGDILYSGPFSTSLSSDDHDPYQRFKVTIPSSYKGPVQLGVAHFFLLGAGLGAELQFTNITVNVISSRVMAAL